MARLTTYSAEDKAAALAVLVAHEGCVQRAADALGINESTLRGFVRQAQEAGQEVASELTRLREMKVEALRDKFREIAETMTELVMEKRDQLSPRDAMIVCGIATDKYRLLSEQATSISSSATDERRALFRDRYGARRVVVVEESLTPEDIAATRELLEAARLPLVVQAKDTPPQASGGAPG